MKGMSFVLTKFSEKIALSNLVKFFEHDACVMSPKSKGVGKRYFNIAFLGFSKSEIEPLINIFVWRLMINCWWDKFIGNG